MQATISSQADFPVLGATVVPQAVQWGPPGGAVASGGSIVLPSATPRGSVVLSSVAPREGVVLDASHPRNTFAKKPVTTAVQGVAAVDWSASGNAAVTQSLIRAGSANHASPVATVKPVQQTPLSVLRSQNAASFAPKVAKPVQQKPMVIQQPRR